MESKQETKQGDTERNREGELFSVNRKHGLNVPKCGELRYGWNRGY